MFNPDELPKMPEIARDDLIVACGVWGPKLWLPGGINGATLLWALAGNESSYGRNCAPRHEQAYCTGEYSHVQDVVVLTRQYGHAAHCSFGPWQLLLVNAAGASPDDLRTARGAAMATAGFLNRRILHGEGAKTIEEIADAYNSGTWRDRYVPEQYVADCVRRYRAGFGRET